MARTFTATSSQYGIISLPSSYGFPFTLAIRVNPTSLPTSVMLHAQTGTTRFHVGIISNNYFVGDTFAQTQGSRATIGTWATIAGVFANSLKKLYINGVYSVQSACTSANVDELTVGRSVSSAYAHATLQDAAFWSRELSDDELLAYHRGASPILMPYLLRAYIPLYGNQTAEPNLCGNAMTMVNGPTKATNIRIYQ